MHAGGCDDLREEGQVKEGEERGEGGTGVVWMRERGEGKEIGEGRGDEGREWEVKGVVGRGREKEKEKKC